MYLRKKEKERDRGKMAGSELKRLKATLKAHGLTGQTPAQTNKKNRSKSKLGKNGGARDRYDAAAKRELLSQIRDQFNPFDIKTSRKKWDVVGTGGVVAQRGGKVAVGKPGISKQIGEEQRMRSYNVRKMLKARKGAFIDKRFGERDKNLTEEEKMLERFTRERQNQSMGSGSGSGRKRAANLFNLEDDDDDNANNLYNEMNLTHGGALLDDITDNEDESPEMGALGPMKRPYSAIDAEGNGEFGGSESLSSQYPQKKKTKAEVMKEIIAKSKFYKHERQKAQMKIENEIEGLDENFDDVMASLMATQPPKEKVNVGGPEGGNDDKDSNNNNNNNIDLEYDTKLQQLALERRAVPSDRTKTEDELQKEAEEKRQTLEKQREDRIHGLIEVGDGEERGVEDLDDNFWSDNEDEAGEVGSIADSDDDIVLSEKADEDLADDMGPHPKTESLSLGCPATHDQLLNILKDCPLVEHPRIVRKIVTTHQPKLAEGNKEKLGNFSKVVLRHILYLASQDHLVNEKGFSEVENSLIKVLKVLSEKFNEQVCEESKVIIDEIQTRFRTSHFSDLSNYEIMFFIVIGIIFSTSDQYHLVVTPTQLLLCEFLEQIRFTTYQRLAYGAVLASISLQYQRISKRFTPELVYFFENALATLLGSTDVTSRFLVDTTTLGLPSDLVFSDTDQDILRLSKIFGYPSEEFDLADQKAILLNILFLINEVVTSIWKDLPAFTEIVGPLKILLQGYISKYPTLARAQQLLEKINRLEKLHEHVPLTLQNHKPVAIPSHAPRFEENYNPERKSYDPDVTRNEINKMKAQLKKERKFTMKEIRKDTRFEARQRIEEKKREAAEYHSKIARIYNTITTEEGAEKNKYEREKRLRTGKR